MAIMPTAEGTFFPLFTKAQEINRKLKTISTYDADFSKDVRRKLVAVSTEVGVLGGVAVMSALFFELETSIARQIFHATNEKIRSELTMLHNLLKKFGPIFMEAPPEWRRGVAFGIIHSIGEPVGHTHSHTLLEYLQPAHAYAPTTQPSLIPRSPNFINPNLVVTQ